MAYLCCPTGFVAFQHTNPLRETRLLEFDRRFALLAGKHFVHYDLDEPDKLPAELLGSVDIAVVDPPFLNEVLLAPLLPQVRSDPVRRSRTATSPRRCPSSSTPSEADSSSSPARPSRRSPVSTLSLLLAPSASRVSTSSTPTASRTTLPAGAAGRLRRTSRILATSTVDDAW